MVRAQPGTDRLGSRTALPVRLADDLRGRLASQEWSPGEQLPTEADLVDSYGVSRATVRQALKTLEGRGLITTRRGRGSFAADIGTIHAGMQELKSISATIAEMGHRPGMRYHHRLLRPPTVNEQDMFGIGSDEQVLDIQRKIMADDIVVAYSYDVLPRWVFPPDFTPKDLTGSVFGFLADNNGPKPIRALANVRAVNDLSIAWDGALVPGELFILLDQLHYEEQNRAFMYTRSYFIEGRFAFTVMRTTR